MPEETLAQRRLHLGNAAIFSPTEAAKLLPGREADNMRWLRDRGLIRRLPGTDRELVRWYDVLAALGEDDAGTTTQVCERGGTRSLRRAEEP